MEKGKEWGEREVGRERERVVESDRVLLGTCFNKDLKEERGQALDMFEGKGSPGSTGFLLSTERIQLSELCMCSRRKRGMGEHRGREDIIHEDRKCRWATSLGRSFDRQLMLVCSAEEIVIVSKLLKLLGRVLQ